MLITLIGIVLIMVLGLIILELLKKRNEKELSKNNISLFKQRISMKNERDAVTTKLLERSSFQQTISAIESLRRGLSPLQSSILGNVIEIIKTNNNFNQASNIGNNIVDVDKCFEGSNEDESIRSWLSDTLGGIKSKTKFGKSISRRATKMLSSLKGSNESSASVSNININNDSINRERAYISLLQTNLQLLDDDLLEGTFDNFSSWDFNVFAVKSRNPQSFLAWKCFNELGIIEELDLGKLQLSNMLLFVEQHYSLTNYDSYSAYSEINVNHILTSHFKEINESKGNEYHNNLHGADVFQGVFYFATTYKDVGGDFTSFDLFSVLFAAYIHDFNHPGLNTSYMISDWPSSGISSTFGSESPLEKHHLAMAFNLMRNKNEFNFLLSRSTSESSIFRRIVTECVIVTDLAKSMPWISTTRIAFNDFRNNKSNDDENNADYKNIYDHKILLMQLSIKCADVGHPSRLLAQHLEWSSRIREEFYSQGDKERINGMKISPLCDRNVSASNYPQSQIGFITYVSKPCFSLMNEICLSVEEEKKPWMKYMNDNIAYWEEMKKEIDNSTTNV